MRSESEALNSLTGAASAAAVVVPLLLAYNLPPSPTTFNQLAAALCWGLAALTFTVGGSRLDATLAARGAAAPAAFLAGALLLVCTTTVPLSSDGGGSTAASAACVLLAAVVVVSLGGWCAAGRSGPIEGDVPIAGFLVGWLVVGVLSAAIAALQVFASPTWTDNALIARSTLPGRAVGNVRQPNHLATLLLWSAAAVVPLAQRGRVPRWLAIVSFGGIVFAITLSRSRTGLAGLALLAIWAIVDRRLAGPWRALLLTGLPLYGAAWLAMTQVGAAFVGAAGQFSDADPSSSRFAIWRNTLELIGQQTWTGVGAGNFNLAWSMTVFPSRPVAFFDHSHNLVLQLLVELGLPLGALVVALLLIALWQAGKRSWRAEGDTACVRRALFVMLLMMGVHSMLEYPLWYAHFLLPTAFAWGACLGTTSPRAHRAAGFTSLRSSAPPWLALGGALMMAGALYAAWDYTRVAAIFDNTSTAPLEARIERGRRSLLFAHHADYARATTAAHPGEVMDSFDIAKHHILDTRLMTAWARAYAERGDLDRARYIADRLREFRNPASKDFFAACDGDPDPRPFQCDPPSRQLTWRDFTGKQ